MSLLTLCYHLYSTCGLHGKFIGDEILRMQAHYNLYNYFILLHYIVLYYLLILPPLALCDLTTD